MPGFDGTGPWGQGPLTGGGRGSCAGAVPRPWGGRGGGRGWRNQYHATGLTGWQRQAGGLAPPASTTTSAEKPIAADTVASAQLVRLEESVAAILERLDRLEAATK
jgi:hypothetical protein